MGSFFLFILIIVFTVIVIVGGGVLRFIRAVTKQTNAFNQQGRSVNNNRHRDQEDQQTHSDNHQKIFAKEEGEYIDYEEVK